MEGIKMVVGILFLLNFFLLMIMIRSNRQWQQLAKEQLHRLEQVQECLTKVEAGLQNISVTEAHNQQEKNAENDARDFRRNSQSLQSEEGQSGRNLQVQEKEALINEVLSEVFT